MGLRVDQIEKGVGQEDASLIAPDPHLRGFVWTEPHEPTIATESHELLIPCHDISQVAKNALKAV